MKDCYFGRYPRIIRDSTGYLWYCGVIGKDGNETYDAKSFDEMVEYCHKMNWALTHDCTQFCKD